MKAFPVLLRRRLCEESHLRASSRTLGRHAAELHAQIESRKSSQTSVDFLLSFAKVPRASTQLLSSLERDYRSVYGARESITGHW